MFVPIHYRAGPVNQAQVVYTVKAPRPLFVTLMLVADEYAFSFKGRFTGDQMFLMITDEIVLTNLGAGPRSLDFVL